jgi:ubiquinone/menaquinone biosynthesis C-methylase UbiE
LAARGYRFYAVEPSEVMIEEARRKNDSIFWTQAAAEALPFEREFFGAALATLTIHHWKNPEKAFAEIYRTLKKGGRLVIFTAFPEQMENYWLNYYFPKMMQDSMAVMPARGAVERALSAAGFAIVDEEKYFIQPDLQDLFLYSGKHRPALYLDAQVRKGISSFSVLSHEEEVKTGLQKLARDMETGDFAKIVRKYENDTGDYIFIVAAKLS